MESKLLPVPTSDDRLTIFFSAVDSIGLESIHGMYSKRILLTGKTMLTTD